MMDRLTKLLSEARIGECNNIPLSLILNAVSIESIADHLLENGVIMPPCKVGDKVFVLSRYYTGDWKIHDCTVNDITIYKNNTFIRMFENGKNIFAEETTQIGKTVFLTREEAEKALAEREGNR
jgi:hypothetical protein